MDTETADLKYRISQMDNEGLLKMVNNHSDYRQVTLDLAVKELARRNITFTPPPPKPLPVVKKQRLSSLILRLSAGIALLSIIGFNLYRMLDSQEEANQQRVMRLIYTAIVVIVCLFLMLTTNESND
jgi:hypothetical protein